MRELSARRQRWAVFVAFVLVAAAIVATPWVRGDGRAAAAVNCGGNRASLATSWGATLTPCLAKVPTRLVIPLGPQTAGIGCGLLLLAPCYENRWSVTGFTRQDQVTVKFADGTTLSLYRLKFKQMSAIKNATLTTIGGSGNVTMTPDGGAVFGGGSGDVNVWVPASDTLRFNIGGIRACNTETRVDDGLLGTASSLGINDVSDGCAMSLNIYYMASNNSTASTTVRLPNTNVQVSQ